MNGAGFYGATLALLADLFQSIQNNTISVDAGPYPIKNRACPPVSRLW